MTDNRHASRNDESVERILASDPWLARLTAADSPLGVMVELVQRDSISEGAKQASANCARHWQDLRRQLALRAVPLGDAARLHAEVLLVLEKLVPEDPAADSTEGRILSSLAESVERYEKSKYVLSESVRRHFSLHHLQQHLPWTIPYSEEFEGSAKQNKLRRVGHDVLHVMKSLGRIAAEVEAADHGRPRKLKYDELAKEAADLVLCALHIARVEEFSLEDAVIRHSEGRNAATIPPEDR